MNELTIWRKMCVGAGIYKKRIAEYVRHDSKVASFFLMVLYFFEYYYIKLKHGNIRALIVAGKIFRHTQLKWVRAAANKILKDCIIKNGGNEIGSEILKIISNGVDSEVSNDLRRSIKKGMPGLFHGRLLILSVPEKEKKGVIIIKYTDYFKHFAILFDLTKVSKEYILVIEPSSCGYFDEDILCLLDDKLQIVIESSEPVDYDLLESLSSNFWPVDVGSNFWVDNKTFFKIPEVEKEYDIIMVSNWADVKRHYHLFNSLSKSKNKILKVALVGNPWPRTMRDIKEEAAYYNVQDRVVYYEKVSQKMLNILYNKAKSYLLLSKKEGFNKALIEAMFAGIPSYMLSGFNYGYQYDYINSETGAFIKADKLTEYFDQHDIYVNKATNPIGWVKANMTPEIALDKILKCILRIEVKTGISINKRIALKVNSPELQYKDSSMWKTYDFYYKNLKTYLKPMPLKLD